MTWVDPALEQRKQSCACGCDAFGIVTKKTGHVRACACRKCEGGRWRGRSRKDEHKVARDWGGEREPLSGQLSGADVRGMAHDEIKGYDALPWSAEVTAEKRVCGPVRNAWYRKMERMLERRRRHGERIYLVLTDEKPWLVVSLYEDVKP